MSTFDNDTRKGKSPQDETLLSPEEQSAYDAMADKFDSFPGIEELDHRYQVCRDLAYLEYEANYKRPYQKSYEYDAIIWRTSKALDVYIRHVPSPSMKVIANFVRNLATLADDQRKAAAWERVERRNYTPESGWVYILKAATGHYKIGRTKNPDSRLETFGIKLPFEVEYDTLLECTDHIGYELYLHTLYAHKRVNGEWFSLSQQDIEDIVDGWDIDEYVASMSSHRDGAS